MKNLVLGVATFVSAVAGSFVIFWLTQFPFRWWTVPVFFWLCAADGALLFTAAYCLVQWDDKKRRAQ